MRSSLPPSQGSWDPYGSSQSNGFSLRASATQLSATQEDLDAAREEDRMQEEARSHWLRFKALAPNSKRTPGTEWREALGIEEEKPAVEEPPKERDEEKRLFAQLEEMESFKEDLRTLKVDVSRMSELVQALVKRRGEQENRSDHGCSEGLARLKEEIAYMRRTMIENEFHSTVRDEAEKTRALIGQLEGRIAQDWGRISDMLIEFKAACSYRDENAFRALHGTENQQKVKSRLEREGYNEGLSSAPERTLHQKREASGTTNCDIFQTDIISGLAQSEKKNGELTPDSNQNFAHDDGFMETKEIVWPWSGKKESSDAELSI